MRSCCQPHHYSDSHIRKVNGLLNESSSFLRLFFKGIFRPAKEWMPLKVLDKLALFTTQRKPYAFCWVQKLTHAPFCLQVSMFTFSAYGSLAQYWVLGIDSGNCGPCLLMSRTESHSDLNLRGIRSVSFIFFHKHSITSQNSVR